MILLLFFCSGATALIYEVIWSDYLTLLFGSTVQAQTVVLAVFMGGLALGNKLFGKRADDAKNPLLIYGSIEIAVGIYAFLFALIYKIAGVIFVPVGSHFLDHNILLLFLNGVLSALLLLGPTILMGGTLPVLAAWLQKHTADSGRRAARFYSINTFGAVCGAWLAGFLLVEWLGLRLTTEVAAVVNLLVGIIAINLGRRQALLSPANQQSARPATVPRRADSTVFHWSCALVAVTGAVSMGLEILSSRCMALIFGASLQSFSIVLISFVLGIGVGSTVISSPRIRHWPKHLTTILLLLITSGLIGLLVFHIEKIAAVYLYAQSGLGRTPMGYNFHEILAAAISICVLGLPAATLGAVLPLWMRAVPEDSDLLGDHVGRLVTWNTLGAVIGVLITGFVLMPQIGMRDSFAALGLLLAAAAIITALSVRQGFATVAALAVGALVATASLSSDSNWRDVFSIGVFRMPDMDVTQGKTLKTYMEGWHKFVHLLFYEDGADATVSVEEVAASPTNDLLTLRIDGKPEASASTGIPPSGDLAAQVMVAQLPLMLRPQSQDVFSFGLGSGITAQSALGYPIKHMIVAENCAPVIRAAALFDPWNHDVMTNDRVRIYHEDARTVLRLSPQKYDVIISEPSNPWLVGIGRVFSHEFYQLAASRLKAGGFMGQWFHLYEMDDKTLDVVLRTFNSVFPYMEIWDVGDKDIVLVGSQQPWSASLETYEPVFQMDTRWDLAALGLMSPQELLARRFASQKTAFAVAGPGPLESDNFPVLEYEAPRAFYMYQNRQGVKDFPRYDERTWQMDLASPAKNAVLASLSVADLHQIFGGSFGSGNPQLQSYLQNRFEGHVGLMTFDGRAMPCVFLSANTRPVVYAAPGAETNLMTRQLYYDDVALQGNDSREKSRAVASIKDILDNLQDYDPQTADWPASYYASIAIEASLRMGNLEQAKTILSRGLQLDPDSGQLQYLSRVLSRMGP